MRASPLFRKLIRFVPLMALVISVWIVGYQYYRIYSLSHQLISANREYTRYYARYMELRYGKKA